MMNKTIDKLSGDLYDKINTLNQKIIKEKMKSNQKIKNENLSNEEKIKNLIQESKESTNKFKTIGNDTLLSIPNKFTPDFRENIIRNLDTSKNQIFTQLNYDDKFEKQNTLNCKTSENSLKKLNLTENNFFSNKNIFEYESKYKTNSQVNLNKIDLKNFTLKGDGISAINSSQKIKTRNAENYFDNNNKNNQTLNLDNDLINSDNIKNLYESSNFNSYNKIKLENPLRNVGKNLNKVFMSKTLNYYPLESEIEDITECIVNFRHDVSNANISYIEENRDLEDLNINNKNIKFNIDLNFKNNFNNQNYSSYKNEVYSNNNYCNYNTKIDYFNNVDKYENIETNNHPTHYSSHKKNLNNNSEIANKADCFLDVLESMRGKYNKSDLMYDQNITNTNHSIENINNYYESGKNFIIDINKLKLHLNIDKGESINILEHEKINEEGIYEIKRILENSHSLVQERKNRNKNKNFKIDELKSNNVINIEIIPFKENKKNSLNLCHVSNVEIVKETDNLTNKINRINKENNFTTNYDKPQFKNQYSDDVLQYASNQYLIDKSLKINQNYNNNNIDYTNLSKVKNFDLTKIESIEILSSNKKVSQNLNSKFSNIRLSDLNHEVKKSSKEFEKIHWSVNDHKKQNISDMNLKAFSENKRLSDIQFNNNFNFTSSSFNKNDIKKIQIHNINKTNNDNNENNLRRFNPFIINKEISGNDKCINNTYNYKTEINIGNNRYDESPKKTLSKILRKYSANTDKKTKEHYRILKELKKFQEDDDLQELELSISCFSGSFDKNRTSLNNTLNNSKGFNSRKNSFKNDSKSKSKTKPRKESLDIEKPFESPSSYQNNYNEKICKNKGENFNSNNKLIESKEDFSNTHSFKFDRNFNILKEKLIDLISNLQGENDKIVDKNNLKIENELKSNEKIGDDLCDKKKYFSETINSIQAEKEVQLNIINKSEISKKKLFFNLLIFN